MRGTIAALLSLPYTTGIGYEAWKQEIVNWISKENNNPDYQQKKTFNVLRGTKKNVHGHPTGQNNADLEK